MQKTKHRNRKFTVITGQKGKKAKKPFKKAVMWLVICIFIIFAVRFVWRVGHNLAAKLLTETVIASEGTYEQTLVTKGVLARLERVVAAPASGTIHWLVKEGERLAVDTPVATITTAGGERVAVKTPAPGIVMLELDGLEDLLQPVALSSVDVGKLLEEEPRIQSAAEGSPVQQGTLLFKVIDNYAWYYAAVIDTALDLQPGRASLRFAFAKETLAQAHIVQINETDEGRMVIFKLQDELPDCFRKRFTTAKMITGRTTGIILPAAALIVNGEETGVYILQQSVVRYRDVEVMELGDNEMVIKGIPTGLPVITTPAWVREGQRL